MSVLFSCPTVTAATGLPSDGGDSAAQGRGPGAERFRVHVGTETAFALRAARRTRGPPGPEPWYAAGRPSAEHPFGPVDAAVLLRTALPDVVAAPRRAINSLMRRRGRQP
jgi:hypothetical protein